MPIHLEKTFGKGDSQSTREKEVAPTKTNLVFTTVMMNEVMTIIMIRLMMIINDHHDNDDVMTWLSWWSPSRTAHHQRPPRVPCARCLSTYHHYHYHYYDDGCVVADDISRDGEGDNMFSVPVGPLNVQTIFSVIWKGKVAKYWG